MKKIHYWLDGLPQGTVYSVQVMNRSNGYVTRFADSDKAQLFLEKFTAKKCHFKTLPQALEVDLKVPNLKQLPNPAHNPFSENT